MASLAQSSLTLFQANWLASPDGDRWLQTAMTDADPLSRMCRLQRAGLASQLARAVSEQVQLRERGQRKFSRAQGMLFTRRGLEQATDARIAAYKAERFQALGPLADLCCGIGGDAMALFHAGPLTAVDADPVVGRFAEHNLQFLGGAAARVEVGSAIELDLSPYAAWHIDPDRRPSGRVVDPHSMHPSAFQLADMLRQNPHAAIKLAPAAGSVDWPIEHCREWVGHHRECQQQIVWTGRLADHRAGYQATVLEPNGDVSTLMADSRTHELPQSSIREFIYEPSSPVIAARLVPRLASQCNLAACSDDRVYLTSDTWLARGLVTGFRVLDVLPFRERAVRAWLRTAGQKVREVKHRGIGHDVTRWHKRWRDGSDGPDCTLFVMRREGRTVAVLAQRPVQ